MQEPHAPLVSNLAPVRIGHGRSRRPRISKVFHSSPPRSSRSPIVKLDGSVHSLTRSSRYVPSYSVALPLLMLATDARVQVSIYTYVLSSVLPRIPNRKYLGLVSGMRQQDGASSR